MNIATRAATSAAAVGIAASGMLSFAVGTAAADPVGPGCADYASQVPVGPGSVKGMSAEPVSAAAANNPLLTTLSAALSGGLNPDVNLVDTLNGGEFTVFAPTDNAFAKLPSATVDSLKTDSATLTKILTYHVVPNRAGPAGVVGTHKTAQGATVSVTGTPEALKVNNASVICGGADTANATVYMIDTVLMPPAG
ncbi:fasciclin domain-containing protein [Mycobacterium sp. NPDC003449]